MVRIIQNGRYMTVLLFTCTVTRALHLQLLDSMSLANTVLSLWWFVARRGLPSIMYSDNAKFFVAAQGKMISEYCHLSPQWEFIAPRSPLREAGGRGWLNRSNLA